MVSDGTTSTIGALALLALPDPGAVSEPQVRGQHCVWCGIALAPENAVDLGPRRKPVLDREYDWFPRGCRTCAGAYALRAIHDHAPRCEQCVGNVSGCRTGMTLLRLIRGGRVAEAVDRLTADLAAMAVPAGRPCEPCMKARIFGGAHECTGVAVMAEGVPCPCCMPEGR
jgi:hypothetical protein